MRYGTFVSLVFALAFFSCKNDDNGSGATVVPPSLLSDVAPEDDAEIVEFLNTHFYNYEDFENEPEGFDYRIVIDTIAGENSEKTPMMEFAQSVTINVSSSHFGLSAGEEDIPHKLYYIEARRGGGGSPTYADSTLVRYRGALLNGNLFDENQDFNWFEISNIGAKGFADGLAQLFAGTSDQIMENGDGTYSIANSGVGIIIMPSGLGYFNVARSSIPSYSILMFMVELGLYVENTDTDNDGIPNIEEDLNGNGYLYDDNTDEDSLANFRDIDDDGDGVLTRSEITDDNDVIILPYPDADNDGVPDFLDPDTK
ncbi:hypothetical protein V1387_16940 [Allomuricauda taeanensis]|uniref:hypothetical protein n=1 Tax=Flagellimonas taeanensis TaxID=1005926 RepID=UPI002E7C1910|nr:hypothetical protein [Allomuricauda taeanensis]MEE1964380.1 hypothetical protein [Allomuricauda taeanensis]